MKHSIALSLLTLAGTSFASPSRFSRHSRLAARQAAPVNVAAEAQALPTTGGIGAVPVGSSVVNGAGGSGSITAGNAQNAAGTAQNGTPAAAPAAAAPGGQGSAAFQPAAAGTVPNPAQAAGNNNAAGAPAANGSAAAGNAAGDINLTVLNFALTLENLESQFYAEALTVMTPEVMQQAGLSAFQATAISQQIAQVLTDEQTHVQILQQTIQTLGGTPTAACSFNFGSVLSDPITFLSTARSIELAGVGAYIGGAGLLNNAQVLSAAATILPIEARHQSALNVFSGGSLSPQSFDIGMSPQQVLALAGGFLQGCTAQDLGLTANQPLSVIDGLTQSTLFTTGSVLQFQTSASIPNIQGNSLSCQMLAGGATTAIVMPASSCIVPPNLNGAVAVFLTSDANPLSGNLATQKAENVVAGPAVIFTDINQGEVLQQVFAQGQLNLRSLPSANLGLLALQPQNNQNSLNSIGSDFSSSIGVAGTAGSFTGLGFNRAFVDVSYGAMPRSVVQTATQLKTVNGGQRNVAVGGGVGAFVQGWLPQNNPRQRYRRPQKEEPFFL